MGLINFEKPKKIHSTEEHNRMHTSDSGVAGTYVPNMSDEDAQRWKGKYITGENERIEIRKSFPMAQVVIVVRRNPPQRFRIEPRSDYLKWTEARNNIKISMNGSLWVSFSDWEEIEAVVNEARTLLNMKSETILSTIKQ